MVSVFDVAEYILQNQGSMTVMKLQKLAYYCQAWSLVWDEAPIFSEKIEAWAYGPVVRELYQAHRGQFEIDHLQRGNSDRLTPVQTETIDVILGYYGPKSSLWLSDLTHFEEPWKQARQGMLPGERGNREITHASMAEYYSSLPPA